MRQTFMALRSADDTPHAGLRPEIGRGLGLEAAEPIYVALPRDPARRIWLASWIATDRVGPDGCLLPRSVLEELGVDCGEPVLVWSGRPPGPSLHVFSWTLDTPKDEADEDVLILLDTSASMADGSLRAACRAIRLFVETMRRANAHGARGDRLGLVTFGGDGAEGVSVACPPTGDAFDQVARLADHRPASGRTPMAHALERAADLFERAEPDDRDADSAPDRRRRVVLLSDGFPDEPELAAAAGDRLRELGVMVAAVGVGTGFDRSLLASIAARTGGPFVDAARIRDLSRILEELSP